MRRKPNTPRTQPTQYRPPALGYLYQDGEYVIDTSISGLVVDIFAMFNEGDSLSQIADRMNDEEWPTANGGKWHVQTIKNILSNRFYIESENPIVTENMFNKAAARLAKLKPGPQ